MKKVLILILFCFLIAGCDKEIGKYVSMEKIDSKPGISIEINKKTLTNKSFSYTIKNNTDNEITYMPDWFIEVYENHAWQHYAIEVLWTGEEKIIDANSSFNEKIDFSLLYGNLKKGKYRFVKHINNLYLAGVFEIE
jgi:uncharacterized protein YbcV (DUF1398 family)